MRRKWRKRMLRVMKRKNRKIKKALRAFKEKEGHLAQNNGWIADALARPILHVDWS